METSATDISRYRGNAQTALGSSSGASASPIWGDTDATRINHQMDVISANNMQKNKELYDRKIRERDELFNKLSSKEMNINQLLPTDRDTVREKYLKPMRDMLIKNPDLRSNPDQWVKFTQLKQDFDEAQTYGAHRYAMTTALDADIAKETDPEKRQRMIEHRNKTVSQPLFEKVTPYQNVLDFTADIFPKGAPVSSATQDIVGDKIVTTTKSRTPLRDFVVGATSNYVDSPNKTLKNQMDVYADSFHTLSDELKAQKLTAWNAKIAEANTDEGLKEGNPNFVPPIAFTLVKDEKGVEHVVVHETAPRIVLAESLLQNYKKTETKAEAVSKLPSDILKSKAAARKDTLEANILIPAKAAGEYAKAARDKAEIGKIHEETAQLKAKAPGKEEANADFYINQVLNMVDPKHYQNLPEGHLTASKATRGKILVSRDANGKLTSALSAVELRALGNRITGANGQIGVSTPDAVIYNYDNPRDPYFVTLFERKDKDGKRAIDPKTKKPYPPEIRTVRPNVLLETVPKGIIGENTTGAEDKVYPMISKRYRQRSQKDNVNGSIFDMLKDKDYAVDVEATRPKSPAPKPLSAKKVPPPAHRQVDSIFASLK